MTSHYLILCRSMTMAQRAAAALRDGGMFCSVTKAPQSANPAGCTYAVKLGGRNLEGALALLRREGVAFGKIFELDARGRLREVGA